MSIVLGSLIQKQGMFNCIKHVIDVFLWDRVTPDQRLQMQAHLARMEAFDGTYEAHTEIAQGTDGRSMKLTITIRSAQ